MSLRRSLSVPIVLAIVMIVLLVVLTVGWVLLSVFGALKDTPLLGPVLGAAVDRLVRSSCCWSSAWCST